MKYCSNCGKELGDNFVFCSACGCKVEEINSTDISVSNNYPQAPQRRQIPIEVESSGLSIAALVFAILGGGIGLILSIIGVCTSKLEENKKRSKAALIISIVWSVIFLIIFIVIISVGINEMNNAPNYYY